MRSQKDKGEQLSRGKSRLGSVCKHTTSLCCWRKAKEQRNDSGKAERNFCFPNDRAKWKAVQTEAGSTCGETDFMQFDCTCYKLECSLVSALLSLFCVCLDFLMHLQYRALVYQLKDHKNCLQFVINNQGIDVFDMKDTSTNEKLEQSFHFESHRLSSSVLLQIIFFLSAYIWFFFFLSFELYLSQSTGRQFCMQKQRLMMATL